MQPAIDKFILILCRMLRPVYFWIAASSLLFLWRHHEIQARKATIQFTVSMEGRRGEIFHQVTLNGRPYRSGERSGVGWKKLVVQAQDAVPFEAELFVWYAGVSFGSITLDRAHGDMDLEFSPAPEIVRITGPEENRTLNNPSRESLFLPTGSYNVEAKFARFSITRVVEIKWNQTNYVAIKPTVATLRLISEPDQADFQLSSRDPPEVSLRGTTPMTIPELPTGEYQLAIARGDYRKNLLLRLNNAQPINEYNVEFRYAKVSFASEPSGATVSDGGGRVMGTTPVKLDLQPGSHFFQVAKDGYFGTNFNLTVSETDDRNISIPLINVSFVEALARARDNTFGFNPNYDRALADVEQALAIKPADGPALQLKRAIQFHQHIRNAKQLAVNGDFTRAFAEADAALKLGVNDNEVLTLKTELEKGEREAASAKAEARRNNPEKVLSNVTSSQPYKDLFPVNVMRFTNSLEAVRAAVTRGLGRKPEWSIRQDGKRDDDTVVIFADTRGFGWKQNVALVVGQTTDTEVTVCFKIFAYTLGENIQITIGGVTDESYKPLHPKYVSALRAPFVEKQRASDIQAFKKRIENELP